MSNFSQFGTRIKDAWSYRYEPESYARLTEIYWRVALTLAALIIIGIATYSTLTFISALDKEGSAAAELAGSKPGAWLDRKGLQATLDALERRVDRYDSIRKSTPQIPDPSK